MRAHIQQLLLYFLVIGALIGLSVHGAITSGYTWQWDRALPYFITIVPDSFFPLRPGPLISSGLLATLHISISALALALPIGLAIALLRLAGGGFSRFFAMGYIQLIRNIPLLVLLLAVYFFIPAQWNVSATVIAITVLALFEAAYLAEIFRGGILGIGAGQWEAAVSLGLSNRQIWLKVILPQAIRRVIPPAVSQSVSLVKDSALVSVIAVSDLAQQSGLVISDTFLTFEIWLPVAGMYVTIALLLSSLASFLEKHMSHGQAQPMPHD